MKRSRARVDPPNCKRCGQKVTLKKATEPRRSAALCISCFQAAKKNGEVFVSPAVIARRASFEIGPATTYVSFWKEPDEQVVQLVRHYDGRWFEMARWWTIPHDRWGPARAALEAIGIEFSQDSIATAAHRLVREPPKERPTTEEPVGCEASLEARLQALKIKHRETSQLVPFRLNPIQQILIKSLNGQMLRRGMVRAIILKARQEGVSSVVQGVQFLQARENPGVEAIVMAHDAAGSDAVFRRTKLFRDYYPGPKLPEKYSNRKEIEWEAPHHSAIRVVIASESGTGRGDTRQSAHLSEFAWWGEAVASAVYDGIANSVPDAPGTMIVIESTANGVGGLFYDMWQAACRGENDFEPIFFSWLQDPAYSLPDVPLCDPSFKNVPPEWLEDEPALRALGATDAQLAWRRKRIANKCHGSVEIFRQEYPSTPEEAFISSGGDVFPRSEVAAGKNTAEEAERRRPAARFSVVHRDREESGARVESDRNGQLRVWAAPVRGRHYLLTADVARGVKVETEEGDGRRLGDFSTAGVYDRETFEEVAVWHGRMDPDDFGVLLANLGAWYNDALACPEANHYGVMVAKSMLRWGYPNMFAAEKHTKARRDGAQVNYMEVGWWTGPGSGVTKFSMIATLRALIRDKRIEIHEPEAWAEMLTFVRAPDGTMDARRGCYDDRVMRLAIAAMILTTHAPPVERPVERLEPYSVDWFRALQQERHREQPPGSIMIG